MKSVFFFFSTFQSSHFFFFWKKPGKHSFICPDLFFCLISISSPAQQTLELLSPLDACLVTGSFALWRKRGQRENALPLSVEAKIHSTKCQPRMRLCNKELLCWNILHNWKARVTAMREMNVDVQRPPKQMLQNERSRGRPTSSARLCRLLILQSDEATRGEWKASCLQKVTAVESGRGRQWKPSCPLSSCAALGQAPG